jgi:hypothetical protein
MSRSDRETADERRERPMKNPLPWFPLHVDSWLFGSTRIELTNEQRAIFIDLVAVGAKDSGYIRANETTPYPLEQLAGFLRLDLDVLKETIERCIDTGKIERLPNGILRIVNWETYALSRQYRGRVGKVPPHTLPKEHKKLIGEESIGFPKVETQVPKMEPPHPSPENEPRTNDKDGLRPIPNGLPFAEKDELTRRRAEIRRLARMIGAGHKHDGPAQLTPEILEQHKKAFNDRVGDFS